MSKSSISTWTPHQPTPTCACCTNIRRRNFPTSGCSRKSEARPGQAGIRIAGYGGVCGKPVFRRVCGVREGQRRRHPGTDNGHQPRAGIGHVASVADVMVPEHLVLGQGSEKTDGPKSAGASGRAVRGSAALAVRETLVPLHWRGGVALHRERNEFREAVQDKEPCALCQRRLPRVSDSWK